MSAPRINPFGTTCICLKTQHNNWPPIHNKSIRSNEYLFPGVNQLCSAILHIMPCYEADIYVHHCLREDPLECRHRNVTLIVRHQLHNARDSTTGRDVSAAKEKVYRYTYCKTNYRPPIHAEEFMIIDKRLLVPNSKILIYAYVQPCHHSSGSNTSEYDDRSCTERLLEWENDVLHPLGITLEVRVASIYKALWEGVREDLPEFARYDKSSDLAREGLTMILRSRIKLGILQSEDYQYIESRVPGQVKYTEEHKLAREQSNDMILSLLERLS